VDPIRFAVRNRRCGRPRASDAPNRLPQATATDFVLYSLRTLFLILRGRAFRANRTTTESTDKCKRLCRLRSLCGWMNLGSDRAKTMMHSGADYGRNRRTHQPPTTRSGPHKRESNRRPTTAAPCPLSPLGGPPFVAASLIGLRQTERRVCSRNWANVHRDHLRRSIGRRHPGRRPGSPPAFRASGRQRWETALMLLQNKIPAPTKNRQREQRRCPKKIWR